MFTSTIPRYITDTVELLHHDRAVLDTCLKKLNTAEERAFNNAYYSSGIFLERAKAESNYQDILFLECEIEKHRDGLIKQAEIIEHAYAKRAACEKSLEKFRVLFISVLHNSAYAFYQYLKKLLLASDNKQAIRYVAGLVAEVFSDCFVMTVDDQGKLTYHSIKEVTNRSVMSLIRSVDQKLKIIFNLKTALDTAEKRKIAHRLSTIVFNLLSKKLAESKDQNNIMFANDNEDQGILLSDNITYLQEVVVACENFDVRYKPSEKISPCKASVVPHPLSVEMSTTKNLSRTAFDLCDLFEKIADQIESASFQQHQKIEIELSNFLIHVKKLINDMRVAAQSLENNFLQGCIAERSAAYETFQRTVDAAKKSKIGNKKHELDEAVTGAVDSLQVRFGGKQVEILSKTISTRMDVCIKTMNTALLDAQLFEEKNKKSIEKIKRERLQCELLGLLEQVILRNKHFWPLWNGLSNHVLDGVYVPQGIKAAGLVFAQTHLTPVEKIKKILTILNERAKASSIRFNFFTVRDDETTGRFYRSVQLIGQPETLTRAALENFKKEIASIEGKNGKLNLTTSLSSDESRVGKAQRAHHA